MPIDQVPLPRMQIKQLVILQDMSTCGGSIHKPVKRNVDDNIDVNSGFDGGDLEHDLADFNRPEELKLPTPVLDVSGDLNQGEESISGSEANLTSTFGHPRKKGWSY